MRGEEKHPPRTEFATLIAGTPLSSPGVGSVPTAAKGGAFLQLTNALKAALLRVVWPEGVYQGRIRPISRSRVDEVPGNGRQQFRRKDLRMNKRQHELAVSLLPLRPVGANGSAILCMYNLVRHFVDQDDQEQIRIGRGIHCNSMGTVRVYPEVPQLGPAVPDDTEADTELPHQFYGIRKGTRGYVLLEYIIHTRQK